MDDPNFRIKKRDFTCTHPFTRGYAVSDSTMLWGLLKVGYKRIGARVPSNRTQEPNLCAEVIFPFIING